MAHFFVFSLDLSAYIITVFVEEHTNSATIEGLHHDRCLDVLYVQSPAHISCNTTDIGRIIQRLHSLLFEEQIQ